MKNLKRVVCIVLMLGMFLAIPAQAQSTADPRGSAFFGTYGTDLYQITYNSFQIWFDVVANVATMDVLGVSEIVLYSSPNGQSWTKIEHYKMADFPQMVANNTSSHEGYVTYKYTTQGYYYRARVTFYARNSTGIGERDVYTEILRIL